MNKPIDIARFVTMTDAVFGMLSDVALPANVAAAVKALRQARAAWPEWDIGRLVLPVGERLVLQPGETRRLDGYVPSDQRFLLSRLELDVEAGGKVGLCLYDKVGDKYVARSDSARLDGCYLLVEPRERICFEVRNLVPYSHDVLRTELGAVAFVTAVHVVGYVFPPAERP